ncbi:MAG: hypothetical protein OER92_01585 [Alphaproteobacteria bacterium]|nr:hypothetical protein [Alphaproteobacteria bacterium]
MEKFSTRCALKPVALLVGALILGACAAPGAPMLRKNIDDGNGPLIPNCQNVSPSDAIITYETAFYHSTWSSALIEGAQVGLRTGLGVDNEKSEFVRFKKEFAYALMLQVFRIDGRNYPFPPFCMKYDAPLAKVADAINKIMPVLGNPVVRGKEEHGLFGTEFYGREHISAKWRDRYIISLGETTTNQTVVIVFRELLISRGKEAFARAESDGHNEAWILTKIAASTK